MQKVGSTGFTDAQQAAMYYGRKRRRAASIEDPYYKNVVLLTSLDEGEGLTATTDKSQYAHDMTSFFSFCALDADRKRFGNSSLLLEAAGARGISIPDDAVFTMGTDDFSIELWWAPPTSEPGQAMTLFSHWDANGDQRGWTIEYDITNNRIVFFASTDGTFGNIWSAYFDLDDDGAGGGASDLFDGLFHFINVDRRNGTTTVWFDGNPGVAGQDTGGLTIHNSTANPVIGAQQFGAGTLYEASGNIDEVRWTIGQSRYDPGVKFDPPELPFPFIGSSAGFGSIVDEGGEEGGDPNFANVSLLLDFDGEADGSTTFTDRSGNSIPVAAATFGGEIDTAKAKFGTGSLVSANANHGVICGNGGDAVFDFGAGEFTVEFDYNHTTEPGSYACFIQCGDADKSPDYLSWQVSYLPATNEFQIAFTTNGFTYTTYRVGLSDAAIGAPGVAGLFDGNWHTIVLQRDSSGDVWLYFDGNGKNVANYPSTLYPLTADDYVGIGGAPGATGGIVLGQLGNYDNVRITKGVARYSGATYTLPTEGYPTS